MVDNLTFFRSSANVVFSFTAADKPYFLRFNSAEERSREQLEAEVILLQTLTAAGLNVVKPVATARGEFVVTIPADALLGVESYVHGVVFE